MLIHWFSGNPYAIQVLIDHAVYHAQHLGSFVHLARPGFTQIVTHGKVRF